MLKAYLSGAFAHATSLRLCARCSPRALARVAHLEFGNSQLRSHASGGLFQSNLEIVTQISAPMRCRSPATRTRAGAKYIAKTEQIAKNIFEAAKPWRAPGRTRRGGNARVAKPIVTPALLGIGKHGISFSGFLEFFFSLRIVAVFVRMILMGEPPICALKILLA